MKVLIVGRASGADIVLNDPYVSRRHAQLVIHDNNRVGIVDLNSKTGTYVNGKRIRGEYNLFRGDKVKIGKSYLNWEKYVNNHTSTNKFKQKLAYNDNNRTAKKRNKSLKYIPYLGILAVAGILMYFFAFKPELKQFERKYGGKDDEVFMTIIQTDDNGYLVGGYNESDKSLSGWVMKLDENGERKWDADYGNEKVNITSVIQKSDNKNKYIVGGYSGNKNGDFYSWVKKIDEKGNVKWKKDFKDSDNGLILRDIVNIDNGKHLISLKNKDNSSKIVKIDRHGNIIWKKLFENDIINSIIETDNNNFLLAGYENFGGSPYGLLMEIDEYGNKKWKKTYKGNKYSIFNSVIQTENESIVLCGATTSDNNGDQGLLIKTNKSGRQLWYKSFGGKRNDNFSSIVQTSDGGYAIVGYLRSDENGKDGWLIKTSKTGNKKWEKTFGGEDRDEFMKIINTSDGGFAIVGSTKSDGNGGEDAWMIKTDDKGNEIKKDN